MTGNDSEGYAGVSKIEHEVYASLRGHRAGATQVTQNLEKLFFIGI